MNVIKECVKRSLIHLNIFQETLENLDLVTRQDKIKWRSSRYNSHILFAQQGQNRIGELIVLNKPLMVSRLGGVEMSCLRTFLARTGKSNKGYSNKIKSAMANNAGFFPSDDNSLDAFAKLYLENMSHADVMGVWFYKHEDFFCNTFCRDAELVDNFCLEPYRFSNPWSARLAGKRVLVVHPFVESINKQYMEKRQLLFASPDILPEFELKTVKAVQSIAGSKVAFATWFDAYQYMCDEIAKVDFDICLIGAGAYGLPLAAFAKSLGKQAIHMGGTTQLLFGIKGRRWEEHEHAQSTAKLFNEHWTRPLEAETPANKDIVDKGCYW